MLDRERMSGSTHIMWKLAERKEQVEFFVPGFWFDRWVPAFLLVFPDFLIVFQRSFSDQHPLVVPLYK